MAKRKRPALTKAQKEAFDDLTPLQRAFVTHLLDGKKNGPAWTAACEDTKTKASESPSASAAQALNSIKVKAFLDSVRSQFEEKRVAGLIMTREESLQILTNLGRNKHPAKLKKVTATVDGEERTMMVVDAPEELTEEQMAAIEEMYNTQHGPRIKVRSPVDAIKQMSRMEGWEKPPEPPKSGDIHIHFSDLQGRL